MSDWFVGQKVVCVDDRFHSSVCEWGDQLPKLGWQYTIARVSLVPHWHTRVLGFCFVLEELKNPGDRLWFSDWRFEPIDGGTCEEISDEELEDLMEAAIARKPAEEGKRRSLCGPLNQGVGGLPAAGGVWLIPPFSETRFLVSALPCGGRESW